ncbi:hypothetical protein [Leucobacter chromiiresistens]|uniref:Uncharacterized protein n=1 Tax=Leucobacter chromiiresistens TaxID=1079994 RepID=A0A1H0XQE8_9MICO|nr:hypothetical protein [Leucobacter chromiiresistens]SDQ05178.1 hypothetical protein SAMN04488565_0054 [Leucobacter chromiiresistens]
MALKEYEVNGSTWQYEEGQQPSGAKLVGSKAAPKPANKAKPVTNKTDKAAADKAAAASAPATPAGGVEDASDPSASE